MGSSFDQTKVDEACRTSPPSTDHLISQILRRQQLVDQAQFGAGKQRFGAVELYTEVADRKVRGRIGQRVQPMVSCRSALRCAKVSTSPGSISASRFMAPNAATFRLRTPIVLRTCPSRVR